jgi:hypothetical protein
VEDAEADYDGPERYSSVVHEAEADQTVESKAPWAEAGTPSVVPVEYMVAE